MDMILFAASAAFRCPSTSAHAALPPLIPRVYSSEDGDSSEDKAEARPSERAETAASHSARASTAAPAHVAVPETGKMTMAVTMATTQPNNCMRGWGKFVVITVQVKLCRFQHVL